MINIEPLGTGGLILPAIVVGFEFEGSHERAQETVVGDGSVLQLDQQAGGYCMSYPTVVGAMMRLEANEGNGKQGFGELVRGLKAMAEDPDMKVLTGFPVLRQMVCTWGDAYEAVQLGRLERYLREYFAVPSIEGGIEAFIRFAACDPLAFFAGWKVMRCRPKSLESQGPKMEAYPHYHYTDWNIWDLVCEDGAVMDGPMLERIADVGRQVGYEGELRVFLLWENSD